MISVGDFDWTTQNSVISWLTDPSEPSMQYLAARDLLEPRPSERTLERLLSLIPRRGWVHKILAGQRERTWWVTKKTCYQPKFRSTIWRLQVLADLGMTRRAERIANAVDFFLDLHLAKDGGYSPYAKHELKAAPSGHLCTTGNMVRSLIRLGYLDDERVQSAIRWLVKEQLPDGGWDCFGRPKGTLDAWEAMSAFGEIPKSQRSPEVREAIEGGSEFFLKKRLLHEGKRFEPWYWLRYPWHYFYDVLVGLDFMTALGYGKDKRIGEAVQHLMTKRSFEGCWKLGHANGNFLLETSGSASKMITFLSLRALKRVGKN